MRKRLSFVVPMLLLLPALPAWAVPLDVVEVSAPAINCVFDADCRITVSDSTAPITLPAASGEGFLQSRTTPPGEAGTPGAGLIAYEYRIDLRQIAGLTALPCITSLALDFGPNQKLDFDGDGNTDDVFVVTGGGLGTVRPSSADRVGDRITFHFAPAVCAGSHPGGGESTFFFGLAAAGPPQPVTAQAVVSLGGSLDLAARSPAAGGGPGPSPGPGPVPPWVAGPCFPGLPIGPDVPVCRCLRDRTLREVRCGVFRPDFYLVRRTPLPLPHGEPFTVSWTLVPIGDFSGTVVVEDGLAPGFQAPKGPARLRLEAKGGPNARDRGDSGEYRLQTRLDKGTLSVPSLVTVEPRGGNGEAGSFQLLLPIGPAPWPELPDSVTEPRITPPAHPDFGPGPCGEAAQRLWNEHVARFAGTPFGLSYAEYTDLETGAERCRRAMPPYEGECADAARAAWASCYLEGGRRCADAAADGCRL